MTKKIFNPDATGIYNGNYFGFPFKVENSPLVLLSVPWDVTASYGKGTSSAPDAIIEASTQLDFYDPQAPGAWEKGIATFPINYSLQEQSNRLSADSKRVMEHLEAGVNEEDIRIRGRVERINNASTELNEYVFKTSLNLLTKGKIVGIVGGDHSTPLGLIRAIGEYEGEFGILHLDAHRDLRPAYQGFIHSHASIMYNVLEGVPEVQKIVQVAVRDFCAQEQLLAKQNNKIVSFEDYKLSAEAFSGVNWGVQCSQIIDILPQKVYVSFDIDALTPANCPNTGTPVPGGLEFNEAIWLLNKVVESGRKVVGFDLCEVAPGVKNNLDADVGARILFKLCGICLK